MESELTSLERAIKAAVDGASGLIDSAVQLDKRGRVRPFDLARINAHLEKYGLRSNGHLDQHSKRLLVDWADAGWDVVE
jgi:hypothetical protein